MRRWSLRARVLVLCVVFVCLIAIGVLGMHYVTKHPWWDAITSTATIAIGVVVLLLATRPRVRDRK